MLLLHEFIRYLRENARQLKERRNRIMNQTPPPHPDPTPSAHIQKDRVLEHLENMDNLLL